MFCVTRQNSSPATRFISIHKVHTAGYLLLLCWYRYREIIQLYSCSLTPVMETTLQYNTNANTNVSFCITNHWFRQVKYK